MTERERGREGEMGERLRLERWLKAVAWAREMCFADVIWTPVNNSCSEQTGRDTGSCPTVGHADWRLKQASTLTDASLTHTRFSAFVALNLSPFSLSSSIRRLSFLGPLGLLHTYGCCLWWYVITPIMFPLLLVILLFFHLVFLCPSQLAATPSHALAS